MQSWDTIHSLFDGAFMSRCPLLKNVCFGRGDGLKVQIWGDNWILTPTTFHVQSTIKILDSKNKVANLVNLETKTWDGQLISHIFTKDKATTISKISLSIFGAIDKVT